MLNSTTEKEVKMYADMFHSLKFWKTNFSFAVHLTLNGFQHEKGLLFRHISKLITFKYSFFSVEKIVIKSRQFQIS